MESYSEREIPRKVCHIEAVIVEGHPTPTPTLNTDTRHQHSTPTLDTISMLKENNFTEAPQTAQKQASEASKKSIPFDLLLLTLYLPIPPF